MYKVINAIIIISLTFASPVFTQLQPFGLSGLNLTALAYLPRAIDPIRTILVAGTDSQGVYLYDFLSPNPSWFNFGLAGKEITALNVQHWGIGPAEFNAIYAAVVPDFLSGDSVILYQQNPIITTPWIAADSGLVFTSGDGIRSLGSIHFYGHTPPRPVFAALNSKVFQSSPWIDWQPCWVSPGYVLLNVIRIYQSSSETAVWAGGETGYYQPFFLKSSDDGITWSEYYPDLGGDNSCYSITVDPRNPEVVYAGMEGQVIKTANGGQNWDLTGLQNVSIIFHGLEIDPGNPDHLLAGGSSNVNSFALYETYNAGMDWMEILPSEALPGITAMAADTLNGEFVAYIATAGEGIYRYQSPITRIEEHILNRAAVQFKLYQNYPNPFNANTTIEFQIPKYEFVNLKICNLLGEEVATLVSERLAAGSYTYQWNASDLATGVYLYRLSVGSLTTKTGHHVAGESGEFIETRRMILLK
jgi:hypothetical protein